MFHYLIRVTVSGMKDPSTIDELLNLIYDNVDSYISARENVESNEHYQLYVVTQSDSATKLRNFIRKYVISGKSGGNKCYSVKVLELVQDVDTLGYCTAPYAYLLKQGDYKVNGFPIEFMDAASLYNDEVVKSVEENKKKKKLNKYEYYMENLKDKKVTLDDVVEFITRHHIDNDLPFSCATLTTLVDRVAGKLVDNYIFHITGRIHKTVTSDIR